MEIKFTQVVSEVVFEKVQREIRQLLDLYGYKCYLDWHVYRRRSDWFQLDVKKIRKLQATPYCGNHPAACENKGGGKLRKSTVLEGGDWVAVNDLINDVLDQHGLSANVRTSICIIRKGLCRRTSYGYYMNFGDPEWLLDAEDHEYRNCCGVVLEEPSEAPEGTPGLEEYYAKRKHVCGTQGVSGGLHAAGLLRDAGVSEAVGG